MLKRLLKYGLFQILILAVSLVTMLYVTRKVSPEGYATYGVFLSIAALMQPFASFSCERLVQVNSYKCNKVDYNQFLSNLIFVTYSCTLVLILISIIFFSFFDNDPLIILSAILVGFRALKSFKLFEYSVEYSAVKYGLVGFSVKFMSLVFVYCVFELLGVNSFYFIVSVFLSEILISLIINYKIVLNVSVPKKIELISMFKFGLPLVLATLPAWVAHESGRVILNHYAPSEAGLLTLGLQLGAIYMFFNTALGNSIVKDVYHSYENEILSRFTFKIILLQLAVALVFLSGFLFTYKYILDSQFYMVVDFFYIILFAFLIQSFALIPVYLSSYLNNPKVILRANILAAVVFTISIIIKVDSLSAVDVSQSFLFAMLTYSFWLWWEFRRILIPYIFKKYK